MEADTRSASSQAYDCSAQLDIVCEQRHQRVGRRPPVVDGERRHLPRPDVSAWCPDKRVSYKVSFSEMGQMSEQARYLGSHPATGDQPRRAPDPPETSPRRTHTRIPDRRLTAPPCCEKKQVTTTIVYSGPTRWAIRSAPSFVHAPCARTGFVPTSGRRRWPSTLAA
jgi:hypothetical protein